jgi:hypothetical protein
MKTLQLISILSLLFLFCFSAEAKTVQGRLYGIDGDTIKVVVDREQIKIRLYGIDTPEKKQAFGQAAARFIKSLLSPFVTVEEKDIDRYGERSVLFIHLQEQTSMKKWSRLVMRGCTGNIAVPLSVLIG